MDIDIKQIRELMRAMKQLGVNELELESQEMRIFMRRGQHPVSMSPTTVVQTGPQNAPASIAPTPAQEEPPAEKKKAKPEPEEDDANVVFITSPFVGTFYRAPSPDAAPFVDKGSTINSGSVLCIVEAMKLMNEIESEISGTIVEILVENGKPVEYGDKLFKVKKS